MPRRAHLALCFLAAASWSVRAGAQSASQEVYPELALYIQQGLLVRVEFVDSFLENTTTHNWLGNFSFYVETALKPVLRRELRGEPDVYRNKYLTFRVGYRYHNSLTEGSSGSESRGIAELTSRYPLGWHLVLSDRNRGEFRFIETKPFSARYRNRLRLERDLTHGSFAYTPYIYDEIFYDSRYGQWTPNRYGIGAQFPISRYLVLEPYYFRQHGSRSSPPNTNTFGFKFNLFL